jgi:DNA-binding NarL/FixJ family response regulator
VTFHKADGLELIKQLRTLKPDLPVLVFAAHDEFLYAERALRAGAKGYLRKRANMPEILTAIRHVLSGQVYLADNVRQNLLQTCADGDNTPASVVRKLSDRELEVFRLLGKGRTTRGIAAEMHLSVSTIETYRANIKNKLNLNSPGDLVRHAVQWLHFEHSG